MRDFYVDILNAEVLSERPDRYCEMKIAACPCACAALNAERW